MLPYIPSCVLRPVSQGLMAGEKGEGGGGGGGGRGRGRGEGEIE